MHKIICFAEISSKIDSTYFFSTKKFDFVLGNMKVSDEDAPIHSSSPLHHFQQNYGNLLQILKNSPLAKYKNELMKMVNMGYDDEEKNIAALEACGGNVTKAINYRLQNE